MGESGNLHLALFNAYTARYPQKKKATAQEEVNSVWAAAKRDFGKPKSPAFVQHITELIEEHKRGTTKRKVHTLDTFLKRVSTSTVTKLKTRCAMVEVIAFNF